MTWTVWIRSIWKILQNRDFKHDPVNDPGKKERYQAEALIRDYLPIDALIGIGCYNAQVEANPESRAGGPKVKRGNHRQAHLVLLMIRYSQGNLLDAEAEAVVNTVNEVGVMGKGIALMFREAFKENYEAYAAACERGEVKVGHMFVTQNHALTGPNMDHKFSNQETLALLPQNLNGLKKG